MKYTISPLFVYVIIAVACGISKDVDIAQTKEDTIIATSNAENQIFEKVDLTVKKEEDFVSTKYLKDSILNIAKLDTFQINLKAKFSEGKLWSIEKPASIASYISTSQFLDTTDGTQLDMQKFIFTADSVGLDSIVFVYQQPFNQKLGERIIYNQKINIIK